jgi:hypothetical protein
MQTQVYLQQNRQRWRKQRQRQALHLQHLYSDLHNLNNPPRQMMGSR